MDMESSQPNKHKQVFVQGPITAAFIGDSIAKHQTKTDIGAHDIFLGQVRADVIDGKTVVAIDYSSYEEMADKAFHEIREAAFAQYDLTCMHIYHSLGRVNAGEICLFVFVSSRHRQMAFDACRSIVEAIKAQVPIFGKELFEDASYVWKENA
jgi:molybdopterin synthase catalytic subunit